MTASRDRVDVAVAGAGPAAWAVAAACAGADLDVALIAPEPDAPWTATYGAWEGELEGTPAADALTARFDAVTLRTGPARERRIARAYAVVDRDVLWARLRADALGAGVRLHHGSVVGAAPHHDGAVAVTADGRVTSARVVVDASGAPAALVRARAPGAWQVAHGVVARFDPAPAEPGSCLLMDWTPAASPTCAPPSFLYALDLGEEGWLVEETVLTSVRPPSYGTLARRLDARLRSMGVRVVEPGRVERVRIPMGLAAPPAQPVVAFGAAAGLVHPATGYSVAASLRAAPRVAAAIAAAVRRGATAGAVAEAGWAAVWPSARRRARALELFGHDALARLDARRLGAFFDAFFALEPAAWGAYVAGEASARDVMALMGRVFAAAPWSVRRELVRGGPARLAGALRRG